MSFAPRRLLPALCLTGIAVLSGAGCAAESSSATDGAADTSPTPSASVTTSPDETETAAPTIDVAAPPEQVRLKGWVVERFPVPAGTEPRVDGGGPGEFSSYIYFPDSASDVEAFWAFYERVLPEAGYQVQVDAYGTVRFAGHGVEGGVVASRGDDVVAVVINRDLS